MPSWRGSASHRCIQSYYITICCRKGKLLLSLNPCKTLPQAPVTYNDGYLSEQYICWARKQMRYVLGDPGNSYVVGYGPGYPKQPQDRCKTLDPKTDQLCAQAPHVCGHKTVRVCMSTPLERAVRFYDKESNICYPELVTLLPQHAAKSIDPKTLNLSISVGVPRVLRRRPTAPR